MNEQERREFGEYIKRLREEKQLSLREAEKLIGISNSYLYQIERGERNAPKPEVLRKMASTYGVSLAALQAAARIQEPQDYDKYFNEEALNDELERAFEYVRNDKRFRFGTHMSGSSLTPEAKRFIVEMYEKLMHRKLIGEEEV